ncbi:MAG: DUF4231 domain-containing protein [Chitinophagaceae bacterium]|nr:DUF4231 domain-containing protein [Chitinophagaceae bacterium]
MNKTNFEDYLKNRYEDQMNYYSKKAAENKDKYRKYQWALIILSALTPVIAALDSIPIKLDFINVDISVQTKMIVVTISAIVAILTTGLKTFNYFELWVTYRRTNEELKREIYYYNFYVGPYGLPDINRESLFVMQVENILDKEHGQWAPSRQMQEELKNPGKQNAEIPLVPGADAAKVVSSLDTTEEADPVEEASAVSESPDDADPEDEMDDVDDDGDAPVDEGADSEKPVK